MKTFNKSFGRFFGVCGVWLNRGNWFVGFGFPVKGQLLIGTHGRAGLAFGNRWLVASRHIRASELTSNQMVPQ